MKNYLLVIAAFLSSYSAMAGDWKQDSVLYFKGVPYHNISCSKPVHCWLIAAFEDKLTRDEEFTILVYEKLKERGWEVVRFTKQEKK